MASDESYFQDNPFQHIVDMAPVAIVLVNQLGIIEVANKQTEKIFGYSAQEMLGQSVDLLMPGRFQSQHARHITDFYQNPTARSMSSRNYGLLGRRKDGTEFTLEIGLSPSLSDDGYRVIATMIDTSERTRLQNRLHDNEEFFRVLYETSYDAHLLCSPGQKFMGANQAAVRLFGFNHVDEITCLTPAAVSPEFQKDGRLSKEKAVEVMDIVLKEGSHKFQWLHHRADGTQFDAEVCLARFTIGGETMIEATVRDITESNRAEQAKNDFISTVRHELRTPLTSINGVLSLMDQGVLGAMSEQAKPLIHMAHKNCRRLTMLINDLLDIEKMESGKIALDFKMHELMPLILQSIEANDDLAIQSNVSFSVIAQEEVQVRVDEARLIQVLNNFMSNAARFSCNGSQATIAVRKIHHISQSVVRVEVVDQGPGIPVQFRDRIFTKFSQADSSDTKHNGGTGLGLAIAKQLIERMGGSIGFYSTVGIGSCFYFELPLTT